MQNLGPSTDMENWGTQFWAQQPFFVDYQTLEKHRFLQNSGSKAPVVLNTLTATPHCAAQSPFPSLLWPETPKYWRCSHRPPQRGPVSPHIIWSSPGWAAIGVPHIILFFLDEAACDSASAAAEIFANCLVIRTLGAKVVNLLASLAETWVVQNDYI